MPRRGGRRHGGRRGNLPLRPARARRPPRRDDGRWRSHHTVHPLQSRFARSREDNQGEGRRGQGVALPKDALSASEEAGRQHDRALRRAVACDRRRALHMHVHVHQDEGADVAEHAGRLQGHPLEGGEDRCVTTRVRERGGLRIASEASNPKLTRSAARTTLRRAIAFALRFAPNHASNPRHRIGNAAAQGSG